MTTWTGWARAPGAMLAIAILLLSASGCVAPAFDADYYDEQALQSVLASESELQTTRIVLELTTADRILGTTADEIVSASETAMASVVSSFRTVQPPVSAEGVQERTMRFLSASEDAITQARIAVRRSDIVAIGLALQRVQRLLAGADSVREPMR